jgi:lambda family phage portal protein
MDLGEWFERTFPGIALRRVKTRIYLETAKRVYDAAQSSTQRVRPTDARSPDGVMENAGEKVRKWARHLDENHDITIGVLDVLVNNVVGNGISIEPMVMTKGGKPAVKVNKAIRGLIKDWVKRPDVTGEMPFGEAQRLACRGWLRDGEVLIQHVRGPRIQHFGKVPYSIELIEPDLLPFEPITGKDNVIHGVEKDGWGRPVNYYLYQQHPGGVSIPFKPLRTGDLRPVPARDIIHLKFTRRFRQTRGVSVLHGVIQRLADIKEYEESERIAARVAASLTAFIQKGEDFVGESAAAGGDRSFEMQPGMIFDNLQAGEEIGMIKSDRPNQNLGTFIQTQQRALAAGTGTNYSSVSKDYNGTYSAQRQELVESRVAYTRLQNYFIETFMQRLYSEFIDMAAAAGLLPISSRIDLETLADADMRPPGIPWIDPLKEIQADALAVEQRFRSRTQIIRDRGGDPDVIEEQIKQERERDRENGFGAVGSDGGADSADSGGGESDGTGDDDGDDDGDDAAAA